MNPGADITYREYFIRYPRLTIMTTNHPASTQSASVNPSFFRHLWQLITHPIGDNDAIQPTAKQASTSSEESIENSEARLRNPELAPPIAVLETPAFQAFTDYADGDEPADLALIELIPAELALLNLPGTQTKQQGEKALAEIADAQPANVLSGEESFEDDEQYLADLIPFELAALSEDVDKTLPDLSAFDSVLIKN